MRWVFHLWFFSPSSNCAGGSFFNQSPRKSKKKKGVDWPPHHPQPRQALNRPPPSPPDHQLIPNGSGVVQYLPPLQCELEGIISLKMNWIVWWGEVWGGSEPKIIISELSGTLQKKKRKSPKRDVVWSILWTILELQKSFPD